MFSIKMKLSAAMLAVALIPLTILGLVNFHFSLTESVGELLIPLLRSKDAALEEYFESTELAGETMASTSFFKEYISFVGKELTEEDMVEYEIAKKEVENLLYSFQEVHWGRYHHVFVIDRSNKIVLSPAHGEKVEGSPSSHLGEETSANRWAEAALTQGVTEISDYSSWTESDHSHQMLFYPVKDGAGDTQAVIGFELEIPYETKLLSENIELGETGKVYMTTLEGVPILYQGTDGEVPLSAAGIETAVSKGFASGISTNSEGVKVIGVYVRDEKHPWIIVAELEAKEVNGDIKSALIKGLLITFLIVIAFSILLSNFIVNPIKRLTKTVESISMGKTDSAVEGLERKDEIGKLARAFDRTIISLKLAMENKSEEDEDTEKN